MKFVAVFLILGTAVLCVKCQDEEFTKEKAQAVANLCKEEVGASDADVEAMFKHEPATSTPSKCLRSCSMKKFGLMDSDGKLIKEAAINLLKIMAKDDAEKAEKGEEIIGICSETEVSDDHCEAAVEYLACMRKEAEEKGVKFGV